VVGYKRRWSVLLTYDMTELPVATRRGKARVFKRLKTIVSCLRDMAIVRFDVDANRCDVSAELPYRGAMPGSVCAQRAAPQTDSYEAWFRVVLRTIADKPWCQRVDMNRSSNIPKALNATSQCFPGQCPLR
jgi:hypothetical protein